MENSLVQRNSQVRTIGFRDSFCNLEANKLRIPRPSFTGMQFIQTRGRQGYYMSTRRRDPWGSNPQPKRPLLSELSFQRQPTHPEESGPSAIAPIAEVDRVSEKSDTYSLGSNGGLAASDRSEKSSSKDSVSADSYQSDSSDKRSDVSGFGFEPPPFTQRYRTVQRRF